MVEEPPTPRVDYSVAPGDTRRRRRERERARHRHPVDIAVVVVVLGLVVALFAFVAVVFSGDPLAWAIAAVGIALTVAYGLWSLRPVRPLSARAWARRPEPGLTCEPCEDALWFRSAVNELAYDWDAVPEPVIEPNWIVLALPLGEVAIPRQAFAPGVEDVFASAVQTRRTAARLSQAAPPPGAARFTIDEATLTAGGLPRLSRLLAPSVAIAALPGIVAAAAAAVDLVTPLAAAAVAGICLVTGLSEVVRTRRAVGTHITAVSGPGSLWIEYPWLVQRGGGWRHRLRVTAVTSVERTGPLVSLRGSGTAVWLTARSLEDAPSLAGLVARLEDAHPAGA